MGEGIPAEVVPPTVEQPATAAGLSAKTETWSICRRPSSCGVKTLPLRSPSRPCPLYLPMLRRCEPEALAQASTKQEGEGID
ncbi:hypothetical protein E2562_010500 [Oryza meyeriana var. granulata]|uniref:Uncharacterized protein n=1 Tax=Oryza meyeriana var. granulata TaxID=110450 RepID=A0A6G1F6Y6_9ORYZ|nr:hypothetical protein E2562_010500 [Oryza meyeriana var. granulata]